MTEFFPDVTQTIAYEGPDSDNPLAFRWYDADRVVAGKTMAEHLRFAVCYWHSFAWDGFDIFGAGTLDRPWHPTQSSRRRSGRRCADRRWTPRSSSVGKLGVPFYCFHDRDIAPEGATLRGVARPTSTSMVDASRRAPAARPAIELLWGTANLFSHPRYQAGAATNPDPEVFAYAAAQVAHCMDATHRLGGAQLRAVGRSRGLRDAAQHRHAPRARSARPVPQHGRRAQARDRLRGHAPDRTEAVRADQAPVRLRRRHRARLPPALRPGGRDQGQHRGQPRHARPATTSPTRSPTAVNAGIFGSIDANAGDDRLGWDLDRFPVSVEQMTLGMLEILRGGGFTHRRAELRHQAAPPVDRPRRPVPRPHRRDRHDGPFAARRGVDPRVGRARRVPSTTATPGGTDELGTAILSGELDLAALHATGARRRRAAARSADVRSDWRTSSPGTSNGPADPSAASVPSPHRYT